MTRHPLSLRGKLMLFLSGLLLAGTVALFLAAREYGRRAADHAYDQLLAGSALAIAETVVMIDGALQVDIPYAALDMLALASEDRVFYRVIGPDGGTVTGYHDLPLPDAPDPSGRAQFFDAPYRGEMVRFAALGRLVAEPGLQGWAVVQVGQTRRARDALARDLALNAAAPILGLTAIALMLGWIGVDHALRPLKRVERDLRGRRPTDLQPVSVVVPEEIGHLVDAINRFMARLRDSMDTLQVFIAEAAHQIRTPLSALRAQAAVGTDETDPEEMRHALARIEALAARLGRLVNQLLGHAMVVHRADLAAFERIDLVDLVDQAVREAVPRHGEPPVELHQRIDVAPAPVQGDAVMLREALKNLLDNAVRHGVGSDGACRITVSVERSGNAWRLAVADGGPGIPAAERDRVFERFYAGGGARAQGSGLGLAIVRRVVDAHGGVVRLGDAPGGGLRVELYLPALKAEVGKAAVAPAPALERVS